MPRDKAPLWCTVFASLSGKLDGCQSPANLAEAVVAGINLFGSHAISGEQFTDEEKVVVAEVAKYEDTLNG